MIGWARSVPVLLAGSFVYGLGTGLFSPASSALTADLSHPDFRGRAMATMYIALEMGIGLGALIAGWLYQDQLRLVPSIFYGAAVITLLGLLYLLFIYKPAKS